VVVIVVVLILVSSVGNFSNPIGLSCRRRDNTLPTSRVIGHHRFHFMYFSRFKVHTHSACLMTPCTLEGGGKWLWNPHSRITLTDHAICGRITLSTRLRRHYLHRRCPKLRCKGPQSSYRRGQRHP